MYCLFNVIQFILAVVLFLGAATIVIAQSAMGCITSAFGFCVLLLLLIACAALMFAAWRELKSGGEA